jgi:hypothetical protein
VLAEPRVRPAPLLLSIVVPALLAGAIAGYLVLPEDGPAVLAPAASAPAGPPSVALEPAGAARSPGLPPRPARPLGITIPAAGVQGPVDAIRAVGGALEIPPPGRAGWFQGGPRPGEPGRAVIVSHVDSREGPALFASLRRLPPDTRILVDDRSGGIHRFRLVRSRQVDKSQFRPGLVYGPSRRPMLVLVTCGGPFTPGEGYRDNVILYARKVAPGR